MDRLKDRQTDKTSRQNTLADNRVTIAMSYPAPAPDTKKYTLPPKY